MQKIYKNVKLDFFPAFNDLRAWSI